ncbi:hypothetical protein PIB30_060927 [Stylosanthes scabra]|uniref:Uncharacterized protein n=1 Tax=Stylosanthes scabra TaxID=79078 RepID=A0ABU6SM44_9FABA|nr:hypothetical protein [Stylosanthes scabra]
MGSEVIYFEIEKREKYEDSDVKVDADLAIMKTCRYHFDDEPFIHPLHNVRFDPNRPYELLIELLLALRRRDPSRGRDPSPQRSGPSRRVTGPHNRSRGRGIALTASRLTPFLPSVALRDRVQFQLGRDAQIMAMRTHITLWCVRIGTGFDLQAFLRDLLVPRALFSHFRSDLSLLNPETLEQTNQGIERNGKHLDS